MAATAARFAFTLVRAAWRARKAYAAAAAVGGISYATKKQIDSMTDEQVVQKYQNDKLGNDKEATSFLEAAQAIHFNDLEDTFNGREKGTEKPAKKPRLDPNYDVYDMFADIFGGDADELRDSVEKEEHRIDKGTNEQSSSGDTDSGVEMEVDGSNNDNRTDDNAASATPKEQTGTTDATMSTTSTTSGGGGGGTSGENAGGIGGKEIHMDVQQQRVHTFRQSRQYQVTMRNGNSNYFVLSQDNGLANNFMGGAPSYYQNSWCFIPNNALENYLHPCDMEWLYRRDIHSYRIKSMTTTISNLQFSHYYKNIPAAASFQDEQSYLQVFANYGQNPRLPNAGREVSQAVPNRMYNFVFSDPYDVPLSTADLALTGIGGGRSSFNNILQRYKFGWYNPVAVGPDVSGFDVARDYLDLQMLGPILNMSSGTSHKFPWINKDKRFYSIYNQLHASGISEPDDLWDLPIYGTNNVSFSRNPNKANYVLEQMGQNAFTNTLPTILCKIPFSRLPGIPAADDGFEDRFDTCRMYITFDIELEYITTPDRSYFGRQCGQNGRYTVSNANRKVLNHWAPSKEQMYRNPEDNSYPY